MTTWRKREDDCSGGGRKELTSSGAQNTSVSHTPIDVKLVHMLEQQLYNAALSMQNSYKEQGSSQAVHLPKKEKEEERMENRREG